MWLVWMLADVAGVVLADVAGVVLADVAGVGASCGC